MDMHGTDVMGADTHTYTHSPVQSGASAPDWTGLPNPSSFSFFLPEYRQISSHMLMHTTHRV